MYPTITEYNQTIQRNGGSAFASLKGLTFIPSRTVPTRIYSFGAGSYAVVFKATDAFNSVAIRCFIGGEQECINRYREIDNYLKNIKASWLTPLSFLENEINVNGQFYPVLKMDWVKGKLVNDYIGEILLDNNLLTILQREIVEVSKSLEKNQIGHGDIQCGNIIVQKDSENKPIIKLIDYDGMYIPAFKSKINLEKGRIEFQHPLRSPMTFDEKMDRFSFWVILCALEALKFDKTLWQPVMEGGYNTLDNMLFVGNDFTNFGSSKLVKRLFSLNQPSLSFYLNKLNKFCNSSPSSVEAPEIYSQTTMGQPPIETSVEQEKIEIRSDPTNAVVSTEKFKRLGYTPLSIDKQTYLNQKLVVTYGTEFYQIPIGDDDKIINVAFKRKRKESTITSPIIPPASTPKPQIPVAKLTLPLAPPIQFTPKLPPLPPPPIIPEPVTEDEDLSEKYIIPIILAVIIGFVVIVILFSLPNNNSVTESTTSTTTSTTANVTLTDSTLVTASVPAVIDSIPVREDAQTQFNLGINYYNGNGVSKDYKQAAYWFQKAAEQGNANAQTMLGLLYGNGDGLAQDYTQAVYWISKAADQGQAIAQSYLGFCYFKGNGVTQNNTQAVYWYRKSAEQGYSVAQAWMGGCYENGIGVEKDTNIALDWYEKALNNDDQYLTEENKTFVKEQISNLKQIKDSSQNLASENSATTDDYGNTVQETIKTFFKYLSSGDYLLAWYLTDNPIWNAKGFEWFRTVCFGANTQLITNTFLYDNNGESAIEVEYYSTGNGIQQYFHQKFILRKIYQISIHSEKWQIVRVLNIKN